MSRISEREARSAAESARQAAHQRILSMTPDGLIGDPIEAALGKRIDELAQAIRDKHLDRLMTFYAPDVVAFDLQPPLATRGSDAYRQNFERWFASFEGPLGFDFVDRRIVQGVGAAFCHYLSLVTGARPGGRKSGYWIRGTTCFDRRDGEWLVIHEHISMPART
jgi:ketosteroid isomerase-like protein